MKAPTGATDSLHESSWNFMVQKTRARLAVALAEADHFLGGSSVNDVMSVSSVVVRSFLSVFTS